MRVNVWDFFMVFGTLQQQTETQVEIRNFQGIYLSPQQAKALLGLLQQNVAGYESAFGEIKLDPRLTPTGRCTRTVVHYADAQRAETSEHGVLDSEKLSTHSRSGGILKLPATVAMVRHLPGPGVCGHLCIHFSAAPAAVAVALLLGRSRLLRSGRARSSCSPEA